MKIWCDYKNKGHSKCTSPLKMKEKSSGSIWSSDNVIKVLLSLSVFLTHPRHQQQFVSIHFPPHLFGLCVPEVTKEKQRHYHIIAFHNCTSKDGHISIISYPLCWRNISLNCHSSGLVVTFSCSTAMKHRKVGESGWYKWTSKPFPIFFPWIERRRTCSEQKTCKWSEILINSGQIETYKDLAWRWIKVEPLCLLRLVVRIIYIH